MSNRKGQVATLLTLGLVVVGSLISLGTSLFVSNQKANQAINSMAATPCTAKICNSAAGFANGNNKAFYMNGAKYYSNTTCTSEITVGIGNYCKVTGTTTTTTTNTSTFHKCTTVNTLYVTGGYYSCGSKYYEYSDCKSGEITIGVGKYCQNKNPTVGATNTGSTATTTTTGSCAIGQKCGSGNGYLCTAPDQAVSFGGKYFDGNGCNPSKCPTKALPFDCYVLNNNCGGTGTDSLRYRSYGCTGQPCMNTKISQSNGPGKLIGLPSNIQLDTVGCATTQTNSGLVANNTYSTVGLNNIGLSDCKPDTTFTCTDGINKVTIYKSTSSACGSTGKCWGYKANVCASSYTDVVSYVSKNMCPSGTTTGTSGGLVANSGNIVSLNGSTNNSCIPSLDFSCADLLTKKTLYKSSSSTCDTSKPCWGYSSSACSSTFAQASSDVQNKICPQGTNGSSAGGGATTNLNCTDNSSLVADVSVPTGTSFSPNASFVKTWRVKNTGTCNFLTTYKVAMAVGNGFGSTSTNVPFQVTPGQNVDISVAMVAPNSTGNFISSFALYNDKGQSFGAYLPVNIVVTNGSSANPPAAGSTDQYGCMYDTNGNVTSPNCPDGNLSNKPEREITCGKCAESYDKPGLFVRCVADQNHPYITDSSCNEGNSIRATLGGGGKAVAMPVQQAVQTKDIIYTVPNNVSAPIYELTGENKGLGIIKIDGLTAVMAL